jgi:hypothetical protein
MCFSVLSVARESSKRICASAFTCCDSAYRKFLAHACISTSCMHYIVNLRHATEILTSIYLSSVDTFLETSITQKNQRRCSLVRRGRSAAQGRTVRDLARGDGALWSGADGPRHRTGRSATWCRSSGSLPDGRTIRACAGAAEDRRRRLDLAPGRDPVREERS